MNLSFKSGEFGYTILTLNIHINTFLIEFDDNTIKVHIFLDLNRARRAAILNPKK